jgi:hypothetical protein
MTVKFEKFQSDGKKRGNDLDWALSVRSGHIGDVYSADNGHYLASTSVPTRSFLRYSA